MMPNHEHEFEAAPGLPEPLPATEKILWQGSPDWRLLGNEAFHLKTLSIYFALMGCCTWFIKKSHGTLDQFTACLCGARFTRSHCLAVS